MPKEMYQSSNRAFPSIVLSYPSFDRVCSATGKAALPCPPLPHSDMQPATSSQLASSSRWTKDRASEHGHGDELAANGG